MTPEVIFIAGIDAHQVKGEVEYLHLSSYYERLVFGPNYDHSIDKQEYEVQQVMRLDEILGKLFKQWLVEKREDQAMAIWDRLMELGLLPYEEGRLPCERR